MRCGFFGAVLATGDGADRLSGHLPQGELQNAPVLQLALSVCLSLSLSLSLALSCSLLLCLCLCLSLALSLARSLSRSLHRLVQLIQCLHVRTRNRGHSGTKKEMNEERKRNTYICPFNWRMADRLPPLVFPRVQLKSTGGPPQKNGVFLAFFLPSFLPF